MENQNQKPIALQHAELKNLLENIYRSDLKSFLTDLAEVIESDNQLLIENLWECAAMCLNDPEC